MKVRNKILVAGALALSITGSAMAQSNPNPPTSLPGHQVPLIMYVNNVNNGPLTTWPEGLYNSAQACIKARKTMLGNTTFNTGGPYATFCCLGASGNACKTIDLDMLDWNKVPLIPSE